jgi:hypothetical protein
MGQLILREAPSPHKGFVNGGLTAFIADIVSGLDAATRMPQVQLLMPGEPDAPD